MDRKKQRFGVTITNAARSGSRYRDTHVFIGGTGAVGGTALLQMLTMYEEMMVVNPPREYESPLLVATGKSPEELETFGNRLIRFVQSRYGTAMTPRKTASGYLTSSGIRIALETFSLIPLPGLEKIHGKPISEQRQFVVDFLRGLRGRPCQSPAEAFETLMRAVSSARPIGAFLSALLSKFSGSADPRPLRSLIIGIPIPSLIAYHLDHLTEALRCVPGLSREMGQELSEAFLHSFREDLNQVKSSLAEQVLVAHTTAVGGMYDIEMTEKGPTRRIRMGFTHAGRDTHLNDKQRFAEELAEEYARIGIKMLITAAAIGVDEVRVRAEIPLHFQIQRDLGELTVPLFEPDGADPEVSPSGKGDGDSLSVAKDVVRVCRPITVPLDSPPNKPAVFVRGQPIRPSYAIRSGENGYCTVPNADALYRVMRVASASELGQVLASVGLFGDDPIEPWFKESVCYYTETDNSRKVFDFIYQPPLFETQLSGLDPMALQNLGSAKHQGELHTLGLLILLHRLETLDAEAIPPYVDPDHFDPEAFFLAHSRKLTLEDVIHWEVRLTAEKLRKLVSAESAGELASFFPEWRKGQFPLRDKALEQVLDRILRAVWAIPSLGSPLLFERDGVTYVRTGFFAAPLGTLVTREDTLLQYFEKARQEAGLPCTIEDVRDYFISTSGFIDLRPGAILCTAKDLREGLEGKVQRFSEEKGFRAALRELEPYSPFSTCGLLAVLFRLRSLHDRLCEAMLELGTLQQSVWQMPRDSHGHALLVPGVVEAFRMVAEGLEKTTGTENLDGMWGYEIRRPPERWDLEPTISEENDRAEISLEDEVITEEEDWVALRGLLIPPHEETAPPA